MLLQLLLVLSPAAAVVLPRAGGWGAARFALGGAWTQSTTAGAPPLASAVVLSRHRARCTSPVCSLRRGGAVGGEVRVSRGRRVLAGRLSRDSIASAANASQINVVVLGGGSFGTAMSHVLGRKGVNVTMVVRKPEVAASINENGTNTQHQSHVKLPSTVHATVDAGAAFADADFVFHAVPVQFTREALSKVAHLIPEGVPIISLSKGIESSTLMLMAEVLEDCLGTDRPLAFLSGPAFASEIAEGLVTAVTIASHDRELANDIMELLASTNFRALYSPDVIGVEIGGAATPRVLNMQSEEENTIFYSYPACFLNTLTLNMHVSMSYYRDQRAKCGFRIRVAAPQEYVNTYSTCRAATPQLCNTNTLTQASDANAPS